SPFTPELAKKAITQGWDVYALKSTMIEARDNLGGYTVPVDFQNRVIERLMGLVVMRGRASTITTSRDAIEIPKETGGGTQYTGAVRVTWVEETPANQAASDTNLTFGMERIPVHTVMASTNLSRNLLEDAAFDLASFLSRKFAEAAAIDEDNKFLTGTGAGQPRGLLPDSGNGMSITEEAGGASAAVQFDDFIGLQYGIDSQYRQRAVWLAEKATYQAIAELKDSNGQYLWRDQFGQNTVGQADRLLGYPVLEQEA
ncbi:unnamed protein product, partial [marine sediment metagenome]